MSDNLTELTKTNKLHKDKNIARKFSLKEKRSVSANYSSNRSQKCDGIRLNISKLPGNTREGQGSPPAATGCGR